MSGFSADWPAPARVRTHLTTRVGGVSEGCYSSNNLAYHVGDDPARVDVNRQRLAESMSSATGVQWLQQVHGTRIIEAHAVCQDAAAPLEADGCVTATSGLACAVMTADCLPVLMCDRAGRQVAAVHAGWRGLAAGILSVAVQKFAAEPADVLVYLGPAISQPHFEVGPDVFQAFKQASGAAPFGAAYCGEIDEAFSASPTSDRYYADLFRLARSQLGAMGVTAVFGGELCTYADSEQFYSYRRDGQTGRMASLIWLAPGA
jgi:YfiH family protein